MTRNKYEFDADSDGLAVKGFQWFGFNGPFLSPAHRARLLTHEPSGGIWLRLGMDCYTQEFQFTDFNLACRTAHRWLKKQDKAKRAHDGYVRKMLPVWTRKAQVAA